MENIISSSTAENHNINNGPSPANFPEYLQYACLQLQLSTLVQVTRLTQTKYSPITPVPSRVKTKTKPTPVISPIPSEDETKGDNGIENTIIDDIGQYTNIFAYYDHDDHLVHIKFNNNRTILHPLWILVGLILEFQPYIHMISINRGLNRYGLHEINKMLAKINITDLCFDGCYVPEGNYDILLEGKNSLRQLSLSRCSINDEVVINLALKLIYPRPASNTLAILNMSSNKITDKGAAFLGKMLRSNRTLTYLNLAGNMLTDEGAEDILRTLLEFPVTYEELTTSKELNIKYLQEKKIIIREILQHMMRHPSVDKKMPKKKTVKSSIIPTKKSKILEREESFKVPMEPTKSNVDPNVYEKAEAEAEYRLGPRRDPFLPTNTVIKDGYIFCCGNNTLSYLGLAYNNLTYITLKKLLTVLLYQNFLNRKPKGLVNFSLEGNNLPVACDEYAQIDSIMEQGLISYNKRFSQITKKRRNTVSVSPKAPH